MADRHHEGPVSPRPRMTPHEFVQKWKDSQLTERSGSHEHFIDLCRVFGAPTPAEKDTAGKEYCFERGAVKTTGGKGWADVWRKDFFAWEYKGKHKNLDVAYAQLQRYAPALNNPPLLVTSDMDRIEVHTNFNNAVHRKHVITIEDFTTTENLDILRSVFFEPAKLEPGQTKQALTEEAASRFASLAKVLRNRGGDPELVSQFLNRILFCLYAQHAKLLPDRVVTRLFETGVTHPDHANQMLRLLFRTMKKGGIFGSHIIAWFNGGLFEKPKTVPLRAEDIQKLLQVSNLDWSEIEPSIFGTLFERGLDPDKEDQIGTYFTDQASIMSIIGPVITEPLHARWEDTKRAIQESLKQAEVRRDASGRTKAGKRAQEIFDHFLEQLKKFEVLDPACGSGNFLYVALQALKDIEHKAVLEAEGLGLEPPLPGMHVGVHCLHGIERNRYAAELARVSVWIGEIQWMLRHGMQPSMNPILKPLKTIERRDAVCAEGSVEPPWPRVDAIVGNPPFLGNKRMLSELGEPYTVQLRKLFKDRLPGGVDLVTYWFERARAHVETGAAQRVGLVATQAIRKGANRKVLDRIAATAPIFEAWTDRPWINEGAAVRVSIIAFGRSDQPKRLDGKPVEAIRPDLTPVADAGNDLARARALSENTGICFMGTSKVGPFEIAGDIARSWLDLPNPSGVSNADVLRPWANGQDLAGRPSDTWIIDFGTGMPRSIAALYEEPFAHVQKYVKPERAKQRRAAYRERWWIHAEARPGLRKALSHLSRFIATPRVAKHRFFVWMPIGVMPDSRLFAMCRDDDFTFGVLSSRFHLAWALANASSHGDGKEGGRPTYTAAACFETFPFPLSPDPSVGESVDIAARRLDGLRGSWLNPPQWVKRIAPTRPGDAARFAAKAGHESDLKSRTLTDLYNAYPDWLANAHEELDRAVADAYGWADYTPEMPDEAIIARLLKLNLDRAADLLTPQERHLTSVKVKGRRKPPAKAESKAPAERKKSA